MRKFILTISAFALAGSLGACESTKEQFDFSKQAPDEFAVVPRAPLEMPPDYNLRPPRPGVARPQEDAPMDEAKQAVFGAETTAPKTTTSSSSSGEAILLQQTGATAVNSDIRTIVDQETAEIVKQETSTVDKLLGKAGKKVDTPAKVVDPVKESERILQNQAAGKPVTNGKTPTIEE